VALFPRAPTRTLITLGYDSGAVATLHCGFLGETAQRAVITGDQGRIEVSRPFYCPESFTLIPANGEPREITEPVRGHGMGYEAEEVMRCLRQGLLESPVIPLDSTLDVMRTLSAVLDQLGVSYPASAAPAPSQRTPTPSSSPTPSS
jgi:hypothetical protein